MSDLETCPICGWSCKRVWRFSNNECDAEAGRHADDFIAKLNAVPNVKATKGGAGYGSLHVEITDSRDIEHDVTIFYNVRSNGSTDVMRVFWGTRTSIDASVDVVEAIAKAINGVTP